MESGWWKVDGEQDSTVGDPQAGGPSTKDIKDIQGTPEGLQSAYLVDQLLEIFEEEEFEKKTAENQ